jgi:hypothetical protein
LEKNNIKTLEDALDCEELWSVDNGTTLCRVCHKQTASYGWNRYNLRRIANISGENGMRNEVMQSKEE